MEILGLVIGFILIITLVMRRVNLGIAMLTGAAIVGIFSPNIGFIRFFQILGEGLFDQTTIELVLLIINVGIIANLMDKTGLVDQMIKALSVLFKSFKPILMVVPSVLGALSIPGGAMLSAPMVDSSARGLNLPPEKKMAINLMYRHVWYFVFPFIPCLILAAKILEYDIFTLIGHLFPITLVMVVTGYFTLFKDLKTPPKKEKSNLKKSQALLQLFLSLLPLLTGIILPFVTPIPFWTALTVGVLVLIIYQFNKISFSLIWQSIEWKLCLGVLGIMIFREYVNNLDALQDLTQAILATGMPLWVITILLPALVSFLTGSVSASVGTTFPLLIPVLGGLPVGMGYVALMFGSAFFFYYLSPVHFCLILTAEYFNVSLGKTYKELFLPTLAGFAMMAVLFFLY